MSVEEERGQAVEGSGQPAKEELFALNLKEFVRDRAYSPAADHNNNGNGLACSWEPGTQAGSLMWEAKTQLLELPLLPPVYRKLESGQGIQTGTSMWKANFITGIISTRPNACCPEEVGFQQAKMKGTHSPWGE